jgi:hypothetical protein
MFRRRAAQTPTTKRIERGNFLPGEVPVVLEHVGDKKIAVIKIVRAATGLGLKEAKELVDHAPREVGSFSEDAAADLRAALEAEGARALIQGHEANAADVAGDDFISKLERLSALRDRGALTEDEFQAQKEKLLTSGE